jgi:hypothetical protein
MQTALPFDDEADLPVEYRLTARARRVVEPERVPALRVVPGREPSPSGPDRADTRPARARAMRRAGLELDVIALRLPADERDVAGWIAGIAPVRPRRVGRRRDADTTVTGARDHAAGAVTVPSGGHERGPRRAERAVLTRLATDVAFARDAALIAGSARRLGPTLTMMLDRPELAAAAVARIRSELGLEPHAVRVVVRVGPAHSGDRVRHVWAARLGLPEERVTVVAWPSSDEVDALEATIHIVPPDVVATVLGWIDAVASDASATRLRETS